MYKFSLEKNNRGFIHTHTRYVYGFTLIEVMVAVSIFAIVVTVGIGALMTVNKGYRQAQVQRAAIDNISFTMEAMAREIRVGRRYTCGDNGVDPDSSRDNCWANEFSFLSFDIDNDGNSYEVPEDFLTYGLDTTNGVIYQQIDGGNQMALTADGVFVSDLRFTLNEGNSANPRQAYLVISITAQAEDANQQSDIILQTSVSQRLLAQ
jgi:prepilin-type N-terminal cleavage/methylation domain-containing protein